MYKARIKGSNILIPGFSSLDGLKQYILETFPLSSYEWWGNGDGGEISQAVGPKFQNLADMRFVEIMNLVKAESPTKWEKDYLPLTACNSIKLAMCDDVEGGTPFPCFKAPNGDTIEPHGNGIYDIYSLEDMTIYRCDSVQEMIVFIYDNYEQGQ